MNQQPNRFLSAIRNRPYASMSVLLLILLAGVTGAFVMGKRMALERSNTTFDRNADRYEFLLDLEIGRSVWLPEVIASSKGVRALLVRPNADAISEQNAFLSEVALDARVDAVYVMDTAGNTLAASNWRDPDTFVGHNYAIRPYFKQALAGETGRYVAKGLTSNKVGFYLSRPVMVEGSIRGIVAVKLTVEIIQSRVEELWRRHGEIVLLADNHDVVFASPLNSLMFKSMRPLPEAEREAIEASRQYGGAIAPAAVMPGDALSQETRLVEFDELRGQRFLQMSRHIPQLDLRLYQHVPAERYWEFVAQFTGMFALAALALFLIAVSVYQRWTFNARLLEAAIRDPLTGLNTRLYMEDWCAAAIRMHERDPRSGIGLAVFDLDLFKQINDTYGHLEGDAVLRQVGTIIRSTIRGEDLAVRFGGEELAVFVRCADQAVAVALAERIRRGVEQAEFQSNAGRMPVTLSGGVAYHGMGESIDALFARADKKLYEAKESGRNRICS